MTLSNPQRKALKAQAHALKPVVRLGQQGLTENVLQEIHQALTHHELIKIKVTAEDRAARQQLIEQITEETQAETIQTIGHVAVLFKRNKKNPKIDLPRR